MSGRAQTFCSVAIALIATAAAGRARAAEHDTATAVLGLEAVDAPDNVAVAVTDALRQRVASSKGVQLVQGKDLVEIKLVFSCPDEAPACMAQAGKSLGASKLIYGNVRLAGSDYAVALKLLDVDHATVENSVVERVPVRSADPTGFRALAPQWLGKLTGKGAPAAGALQVQCNVRGATISLDGVPVGVTTHEPLSVTGVAPGKHELTAHKAGYETRTQQFTMGTAQSLPLSLTMIPSAAGAAASEEGEVPAATAPPPTGSPDAPSDEPPRTMARAGFWISLALTGISLGAATVLGLQVRQINGDLDSLRRFRCTSSPTGWCLSDRTTPGSDPNTYSPATKASISQKLDEADRDRTYQIVSLCVGGAVALAGGLLYYKGYVDKEGGSGPKTSENRGLRIFPTGTPSSGGIVAEFDF